MISIVFLEIASGTVKKLMKSKKVPCLSVINGFSFIFPNVLANENKLMITGEPVFVF